MVEPTTDGKSLIYSIKSKGPRIETGDQSEAQPFITTRCLLVVKNEENQLSMEPLIP